MFWWIAAIAVAIVAMQALALLVQGRVRQFDKAAIGVQGLATTAALMIAGYWYVYERKGQPQANTRLAVVGLKIARDYVGLETRFSISNLGATLLLVGDADVRLQAANPDSLPLQAIADLPRGEFPDRIDGQDVYDDGVLMWPTLKWFQGGATRHLEPGETDLRVVDFVVPCRVKAARVLFMMRRPGTDQKWSDQAFVDLAGLCSKRVGSKEVLSGKGDD